MLAMLSFILECATSTSGTNARFALRRRVSMSEIGSVITLPTGFGDARNQTGQGHLPECQARAPELAQIGVPPAADGTSDHEADRARVALQPGQGGVIALRLQFRPQGRLLP